MTATGGSEEQGAPGRVRPVVRFEFFEDMEKPSAPERPERPPVGDILPL